MKILLITLAILCAIGCYRTKITCKDGRLESLECGGNGNCRDADYNLAGKACRSDLTH